MEASKFAIIAIKQGVQLCGKKWNKNVFHAVNHQKSTRNAIGTSARDIRQYISEIEGYPIDKTTEEEVSKNRTFALLEVLGNSLHVQVNNKSHISDS